MKKTLTKEEELEEEEKKKKEIEEIKLIEGKKWQTIKEENISQRRKRGRDGRKKKIRK